MKNELIEDLVSEEREIMDLSDFLKIHYPEILIEYEKKKNEDIIFE